MGSAASSSQQTTVSSTPRTAPQRSSVRQRPPSTPTRRQDNFENVEFQTNHQQTPRNYPKQQPHLAAGGGQRWNDAYSQAQVQNNSTEWNHVVNAAQRQNRRSNQQPHYNHEEIVLETFNHNNGQSYTCLYQNGERFYLDSWDSQQWHPFPMEWYAEGQLVTDSVINEQQQNVRNQINQQGLNGPVNSSSQQQPEQRSSEASDDRNGYISHPSRGKIHTYIFEEKRNIHCFFDKETGSWLRLPIAWELHSPMVNRLLAKIEDAVPEWKDKQDMLAALRVCNYDPDECISTYLACANLGALQAVRGTNDARLLQLREDQIEELQNRCLKLIDKMDRANRTVQEEKDEKAVLQVQVEQLQEMVTSMEVDRKTLSIQMEAMQNTRPKSAASLRPTTPRPASPQVIREVVEKETVDPDSVKELWLSSKQVHKSYLKLKQELNQRMADLQQLLKQTTVGVMRLKLADSGQSQELDNLREMYRKEAMQRKLLYNKLQELRGNIRVFCRCRRDDSTRCSLTFPSDHEVLSPGSRKTFKFDKVFNPDSTQSEVFEEVKPIITSCVDGYNVCIMAYGQTGAGKTHTMMGPAHDPGVNIRSIKELLQICTDREKVMYTLKCSMVEIYNETIQDLLTNNVQTLDIRTQGKKIMLPNLTEMFVESLTDIQKIMQIGEKNRSVAETKMNSASSRSHLLLIITVEGHDKVTGAMSVGTLTLCDLAGSERVSKSEAQGQRLVEAAAINKSLSALGQIFTALRTNQLHVPFRNSKLTHLLQPSMSGDAKACLFVNISPAESNLSETGSTLQFGSNARQVALGQAKQNVQRPAPVEGSWVIEET